MASSSSLLPYSVLLLAVLQEPCVSSVKLLRAHVPRYKLHGDQAVLQCAYDLEDDALYSVNWYKDDEQFYRYVPRVHPPQRSYNIRGASVDEQQSDDKKVVLLNLTLQSTGDYRCDVTADSPSFSSVYAENHMEVVALPKEGPSIFGDKRMYQTGDEINLSCTSGKSYPASDLKWFINGQQVLDDDPRLEVFSQKRDPDGFLLSSLGLRFVASGADFVDGSMSLRCVAEVAPVLWQEVSESVIRRGTPPSDNTREALFLGEQMYVGARPAKSP